MPAIRPPPPTLTSTLSGPAALLLDLARQRAGAGDHLGLVVGMRQQRAGFALARQAGLQRLAHRPRPSTTTWAPSSRSLACLAGLRHCGHEHFALHAERARRRRGGDAGIAAGGDDHAAGGNGVGQQAVEHAARLEAAAHLQMLQLEPDLGAVQAQRRAGQLPQRRATQEDAAWPLLEARAARRLDVLRGVKASGPWAAGTSPSPRCRPSCAPRRRPAP